MITVAWKHPVGPWSVSCGGILLPPTGMVHPGSNDLECKVVTLCGKEEVQLTVARPSTVEPIWQFARRLQIVASMQHVIRYLCETCETSYRHALTPAEKKFVYATQPTLGPIVGFEGEGTI